MDQTEKDRKRMNVIHCQQTARMDRQTETSESRGQIREQEARKGGLDSDDGVGASKADATGKLLQQSRDCSG